MMKTKEDDYSSFVGLIVRDAELMPQVQAAAETVRRLVPDNAAAIVRRWLGNASRYGKV